MASEFTEPAATTGGTRGGNGRGTATATYEPIQAAVHEVRGALEGVGRSVPGVARASRAAAMDVFRAIEKGSDERVSAGVTFSLGLAVGMLVGGAPRALIALTLVPLVAMGLVLADRRARPMRVAS